MDITYQYLREHDVNSMDTNTILSIYQQEKNAFPMDKIRYIVAFVFSFLILILIKGSKNVKSLFGWNSCSAGYFSTIAFILLFALVSFMAKRSEILKIELKK